MGAIPILSRDHWHQVRATHIGGSDVASLFHVWQLPDLSEAPFHLYEQPADGGTPLWSVSPYKTGYRLWHEKRAGFPADDLDEVERIQAGTFLEPALADWAQAKWDWPIRKVHRYLQHPTVPGWGVSLDYEVHAKGEAGTPVELKNVDFLVFRDGWTVDNDEIVGLPLHINLQIQAQIGAAQADHGYVVACVGGNKLYRGKIPRHDGIQALLATAIEAFWSSDAAPAHLADADSVAKIQANGAKAKVADLKADNEAPALARRYNRLKRHEKYLEAHLSSLKGRLGAKMGDATKAIGQGFTITWPSIERPEKIIPERVQEALTYRGGFTLKTL